MSGTLVYDDTKVNSTISQFKSVNTGLHSIGDRLTAAISQLTSATGFGLLGANISAGDATSAVESCTSAINNLVNTTRSMQIEILMYDGNDSAIKSFLSTLSEDEVSKAPQELKDVYSKLMKTSTAWYDRVGATILTGGISLVEGILDFGETLLDLGDLAQTGVKSIFTGAYDLANKLLGNETSKTKEMWEETKSRVSDKKVESIFNSFYDETKLGQSIKNNAYFFDQVRSISSGIAQTVGITSLGVLTCGASMGAAGSISATRLATIAGSTALSSNTEDAWANGASLTEGLARGAAGAVWDGAQWFVGAKIGADGGLGDQLANKIFKGNATRAQISATRIALDAVDSGVEGYVQPALDLMYKDSYINADGEEVVFASNATLVDKYKELYDDAGGFSNVLIQAAIGAGGSAIGEVTDAVKLLKPENNNLQTGAGITTAAAGTSLAAKAKSIFSRKTESDLDISTTKPTTSVSLRETDMESDFRYHTSSELDAGKISDTSASTLFESDIEGETRKVSNVDTDTDVSATSTRQDIDSTSTKADINEPELDSGKIETKRPDTDIETEPSSKHQSNNIDSDASSTKVFASDETSSSKIETSSDSKVDTDIETSKQEVDYENREVKQQAQQSTRPDYSQEPRQTATRPSSLNDDLFKMLDDLNKSPSESTISKITAKPKALEVDMSSPKTNAYYTSLATSITSGYGPSIIKNIGSIDLQELVIRNASSPPTLSAIATNLTGRQLNDTITSLYRHNDASYTQLANSLISSVRPQNLETMIKSGEIRYSASLPDQVRKYVINTINTTRESFFSSMDNGTHTYGVAQNATRTHVSYEVQRQWVANESDLAQFLKREWALTDGDALSEAHYLATPGTKMTYDEYNMVSKYLVQNLDYDVQTLTQIQRYGFTRKQDIRYEAALDRLVSTGTDRVTATKMLDSINTTGTCSYATVANLIVERYKDFPDLFEKDFGFKLYREVDGKLELNATELMADMYSYVNSDACNGSLFRYENGRYTLQNPNIDTANQLYMTSRNGIEQTLTQYLQSKNSSIRVETSSANYTPEIRTMYPPTADKIKEMIANSLQKGEQVSLGLEAIPSKDFNFYDSAGNLCESTRNWNEGGAHAVYVTGITDKAVIVSTWGEKRYILFEDFENNQFNISTTKITGIDGKTMFDSTIQSTFRTTNIEGPVITDSIDSVRYYSQDVKQTATRPTPNQTARTIYDTKLTPEQRIATVKAKEAIIRDLNQDGKISSETGRLIKNLDARTASALLENSTTTPSSKMTEKVLFFIDQRKLPEIMQRVIETPSSKIIIEQLKPKQVADCLISYLDSPKAFAAISENITDTQLAKAINGLTYDTTPAGYQNLNRVLAQIGKERVDTLVKSGITKLPNSSSIPKTPSTPKPSSTIHVDQTKLSKLRDLAQKMNQDYNGETKRLSLATKEEIRTLDPQSAAKLLESSAASNSKKAIIDVLDSLSSTQLPDTMTILQTSPRASQVLSQLNPEQIETVIKKYSTSPTDLKRFMDNLSPEQTTATFKSLISSRRPPSYETLEPLLPRVNQQTLSKMIDNGVLDNYVKRLTPEQLNTSALKDYTLVNGQKRAVLTKQQMEQYKKITTPNLTPQEFKRILNTADNKTIISILGVTDKVATQQVIIGNMSPSKATEVIKLLREKNPSCLTEMVQRISTNDRTRLIDSITAQKSNIDQQSVELVISQLDDAEITTLIEQHPNGLRNYLDTLSPEKRKVSALSKYTIEVFSDNASYNQRKYLLMSQSEQKMYQELITKINHLSSSNKTLSPELLRQIQSSPQTVTTKLLDQLATTPSPANARLLNEIYQCSISKNPNILAELISMDYNGAGKIISQLDSIRVKDSLTQYLGKQSTFETIMRNTSSSRIQQILQMNPSSSLVQKINGSVNMKWINGINSLISNNTLGRALSTYNDTDLGRIIHVTFSQKVSDSKVIATRIIQEIDPQRLQNMVENGTLKYNANLPANLRRQIEAKFSAYRTGFFETNDTGKATFGVDQALSGKYVVYNVEESWIDRRGKESLVLFLKAEQKLSDFEARLLADQLARASTLSVKNYKIVSDYLSKEMSYSPERIARIKRDCFKIQTSSPYQRMVNKLTSSGLSEIEARRMIDCINVDSGACSYADVANVIVHSYRNNPSQFEKDFGFPLFIEENGVTRINSEELLFDMFTTINSDKCGGILFRQRNGQLVPTSPDISSKNQQYLSNSKHGIKDQLVDKYLKTKNASLSYRRHLQVYDHLKPNLAPPVQSDVITSIGRALQEGKEVSLGVCHTPNKRFSFLKDGIREQLEVYTSTNTWNEGGGHAIYVTGMTDTHVIVATWGKKMYIPLQEFYENKYTITISTIGGIK